MKFPFQGCKTKSVSLRRTVYPSGMLQGLKMGWRVMWRAKIWGASSKGGAKIWEAYAPAPLPSPFRHAWTFKNWRNNSAFIFFYMLAPRIEFCIKYFMDFFFANAAIVMKHGQNQATKYKGPNCWIGNFIGLYAGKIYFSESFHVPWNLKISTLNQTVSQIHGLTEFQS